MMRSPIVPPLPPTHLNPAPPVIANAHGPFVEGAVLYDAGRFSEAAERFLAVADVLAAEPGAPYFRELAINRLIAYRNAAIAWEKAGTPEETRRALEPRLETDPACAEGIRELLAVLPAPEVDGGAETPDAAGGAEGAQPPLSR